IGGTTAGIQFGQLVVSGVASFAGTLNVVLINGYVPSIGDQFNIAQFSSKTGSFSAMNGFLIGGGKQFSLVQNATTLTLSVTNIVSTADLIVSKSHVGSFTQGQTGVAYTITASNVGQAPTSGAVTVSDTLPSG